MAKTLRLRLQLLVLLAHISPRTVAQQSPFITLAPNQTLADAGYDASSIISPSFAGLGIEASNLFSFTGADQTNQMSVNLLATLANYTGVAPHLRIGGNTQDYLLFDSSFNEFSVKSKLDPQGQGAIPSDSMVIGPAYLQALDRFPAGTPITFGLNLAYEGLDWPQRIVELANVTRSMLNHVQLVSFEIGNEPDLYLQNGFRTGAWDGTTYTVQWRERAAQVYEQVLKPFNISASFFEPACTASTIGTSFEIQQLAQAGILSPAINGSAANKSYVATFNQHDYYYYINVSTYALDLNLFQNLQETRTQFNAWIGQTQQAYALGIPYALREMASVGPIGEQGISDTFGAALWTLDFFLFAATLNISSVQMHMTDNSFAAPWAPIKMYGMDPHVRPNFYAFAAMAQIIGGGCNTRVQSLPIPQAPAAYANHLVGYSVYRGDDIAAIVLINTMVSNSTVVSKPALGVSLKLPRHANSNIFVSSLLGPGTDATVGTTWNGLSYETQDSMPLAVGGLSAAQQYTLDDTGAARVQVRDASAIVIQLGDALGTGSSSMYDSQACQILADSLSEPNSSIGPDSGEQSSNEADASALASAAAATATAETNRLPSGPDATRTPNAPDAAAGLVEPPLVTTLIAVIAGIWFGLFWYRTGLTLH